MRTIVLIALVLIGNLFGAESSPSAPSPPTRIPKVVVSAPVWRDFGFSIGGRPKFLVPTKNARFAKLSVGKSIAKGSPADTAGLKPGDIIEKIDGVSSTELTLLDVDRKLFGKKLGDRVVLEIRRPNEEKARTVELVIE